MVRVILKPKKARPFYARHPWVLDSAIDRVMGEIHPGDHIELHSHEGKFIAHGIWSNHSQIRIRLYSWNESVPINQELWTRRIADAVRLRGELKFDDPQGAARLIFSEADMLSGLVVDRYARYLVAQVNSQSMGFHWKSLLPILVQQIPCEGVILRLDHHVTHREWTELTEGPCHGAIPDGPVFVVENGLRFGVDILSGQKTGMYLDQRENHLRVAQYSQGKRVLDLFCYNGAFSLNAALHGQARECIGIDSSERAISLARACAELNSAPHCRFESSDVFARLNAFKESGDKFGLVILDPPKFAHQRQAVPNALKAYYQINRQAVDVLEPHGILVTCSCSGHVTPTDLQLVLARVAENSGRDIQLLEQRGPAPDHPVSATCLESGYLKCFICRVI